MEKVHQSAVVLSPPQSDWDAIQAIRQKYDRNVRRWMPHITLLYPFYPKAQFESVADQLAVACKRVDVFTLSFSRLQYFQHGRSSFTLWLVPEPNEAVCALQEALWKALPDCDDTRKHKDGFTPHLSVGQVRSRQDLDVLLPELQAQWHDVTVQAKQVDLIWRSDKPDDVFRVGYSIVLGTGKIHRIMM
jgi:RNA 2',3'-cyclic 3'-phosphodiesterase